MLYCVLCVQLFAFPSENISDFSLACTGTPDAGDLLAAGATTICSGESMPVFTADFSAADENDPGSNGFVYIWLLTEPGSTLNDIYSITLGLANSPYQGNIPSVPAGFYCMNGLSFEGTFSAFIAAGYTSVSQIEADILAGVICADIDKSQCIPLTVSDCPVIITEACGCRQNFNNPSGNGNASNNFNGQFNEEIAVTAPSGQAWFLDNFSGFFRAHSQMPPSTPYNFLSGHVLAEIPIGGGLSEYVLEGIHVNGVGYQLNLKNSNGTTRSVPRTICHYPQPTISGLNYYKKYCENSGNIILTGSELNGQSGTGRFEILQGNSIVQTSNSHTVSIDPVTLGLGSYAVNYYFDGGIPMPNDPAQPGCEQVVSESFQVVQTTGAMACNNSLYISLDRNCEAEINPDFILEGSYGCYDDYEVTLMIGGQVLPTSPVANGSHIGQTISVKVTHLPSGNRCWSAIAVSDRIAPTITCGGPFTIDCIENPNSLPVPSVWDGCDANPQLLFVSENVQLDICGTTVITRTYRGRDYRGNISAACSQEIKITQATINFPEDVTWTCEQYAAFPNIINPENLHKCLKDPALDAVDDVPGKDAFSSWTDGEDLDVNLNPLFDDDFDNPLTDPIANVLDNPTTTVLDDPIFSTLKTPTNETDDQSDVCNLSVSYTNPFLIYINTTPHIPDTIQLVNYPTLLAGGLPIRGLEDADILAATGSGVPNVKDSDCPYHVTYNDELLEACPGVGTTKTFKILRKWTLFNTCTNQMIEDIQVIKVIDNVNPTIKFDNFDNQIVSNQSIGGNNLECASAGRLDVPIYFDNCSGIAEIRVFTSAGEGIPVNDGSGNLIGFDIPFPYLPRGNHEVTYAVTDGCGNNTSEVTTIKVIDGIPPVPICREYTQISLTTMDLTTTAPAASFDEGSYDNCGSVYFKIRRMDNACAGFPTDRTRFGDDVNFCCMDVGDTVNVVVRVYDINPGPGLIPFNRHIPNANDCMIHVLIDDKVRPNCIPPADVWTTCDQIPGNTNLTDTTVLNTMFGSPIATDNCEADTQELSPTIALDNCGVGTITRAFRADDVYGNRSVGSCRQTIMVQPNIDYEITFPDDHEIDCMTAMPDSISYKENGCDLMAVNVEDLEFLATNDGSCKKVFRTYRIIDWCEYDGISQPDILARQDFNNDGKFDGFTIKSDGNWLTRNGNILISSSGYYEYTQHIKIFDGTAPTLNLPNQLEFCGGDLNETTCTGMINVMPEVIELCTPNAITSEWKLDLFNDGSFDETGNDELFGRYPLGTHSVQFDVSDDCGNTSRINFEITIIDCKAPTPVCHSGISIDLNASGAVELWASDFNASSYDYCNGLKFRLNRITDITGDGFITEDDHLSNPPSFDSVQYTCLSSGLIEYVQLWVGEVTSDTVNNWDYCTTWVEVQDNFFTCAGSKVMIEGEVKMENGVTVGSVEMAMSGDTTQMMMTPNTGEYRFDFLVSGDDFTVTPERDDVHNIGISTFDLVQIQKHILFVQFLDSPYKIIAADANRSNSVTTLDVVSLRKMVLRVSNTLPNGNTSWRFVDSHFNFPNPLNPWQTQFPEAINMNNLTQEIYDADFVAIKVGDVTLDVNPNVVGGTDDRNFTGVFPLSVKDIYFEKGEQIEIPITAKNLTSIAGMQASFYFDNKTFEFVSVEEQLLTMKNFGLNFLNDGFINASWINRSEDDEAILFSLILESKADGKLSDYFSISEEVMPAEAYDLNDKFLAIGLDFGKEPNQFFTAKPNYPNPFSTQTTIEFDMPKAADVQLTISDVKGKVVVVKNKLYPKGNSKINISADLLTGSGVYIYQLKVGESTKVGKMIMF